MGRNNDTFTLIIDRNKEVWSKFRRALRKEDQLLFDEMWRAPKLHLAAGAFFANETPLETIFMTMLLEQYKKVRRLEALTYPKNVPAVITMTNEVNAFTEAPTMNSTTKE